MQSFSTKFKTIKRLKNYIVDNALDVKKGVYIQLLLPKNKEKEAFEITQLLKEYFKKDHIFGISTKFSILNGSICDDIVINFFDFEDIDAELVYKKNLYDLSLDCEYLYFLYSVDLSKRAFLSTIKCDSDISVVGSFYNDFILFEDDIYTSGYIYLKIKKEFYLDIKVVDSIVPIGRELEVNSSQKDSIKKIDKFSPREFYQHYLSKNFSTNLVDTSFSFPLLKVLQDGYSSSIILNEKDDGVEVDFDIKNGDRVRLGFSNSLDFFESYEKVISELNQSYSDLLFVISSTARKAFFAKNGFDFDEAIGLSSNSQLLVHNGKMSELSHSIIVVNIDKNSQKRLRSKRYGKIVDRSQNILELDALSNVAKVASSELEELNQKLQIRVKKEVEKNLRKDSILIHRSRLAQMGEMISLIAHQWKQPLSAISATSSGLHIKIELDMYDKEFFLKSLSKIEEFVNHLSTTIDDFTNFFKPSKIKRRFFLKDAIKKALSIATYSLSKNSIDVELDLDESLEVESYQNELIQVLLNLIKNAENILVKRGVKEPRVTIKLYQQDGKKIIDVIDNGGGIEPKIIKKIFEPYFSTKATKNSTGLGLYMSKFIVSESLQGELKVKNSDVGAIFSIILV